MANQSSMKKWVAGVVVASVVWSGAAWTSNVAHAAATPFSDVVSGHWAEKHIAKLSAQQIMIGSNGKFAPNRSLTRQEAVIVALRFMGIDGEAETSEATLLPSTISVKSDYKKYIDLAFKKQLLLMTEESSLAKSEEEAAKAAKTTYSGWGAAPATREWMARLLVRAIGKNNEALTMTNSKTDFADDAKIAEDLKAYVKVAVDYELVKGEKTSAGMAFKPTDAITRATASTLISRAEKLVDVSYKGQVSGTMMNITSDKLTLLLANGTTKDYPLSEETVFYRAESDTQIQLTDLILYGVATIITGTDGKAAYVEMINDTPQVKSVEGKLILSTPAQKRVTLVINDNVEQYFYDDLASLKITDAAGQSINLADLPLNTDVKLSLRHDDKIIAIAVKQSLLNKSGSGTVSSWDPLSLKLSVVDAEGKPETFEVAASAPIKLNGTIPIAPSDLLVGDQIAYEVKSGSITNIVVTRVQTPVTSVTGAFESLNKTDKYIVYKENGEPKVKYLVDKPSVKITGFVDATVDDLVKGDTITMTLDDKGNVTAIAVTDRSVEAVRGAVVVKYDPTIKTLTFTDANGKIITKNVIEDKTRIDLNGEKLTLSAVQSLISTPGMRLTIGYNGEDIVYVSLVSRYTGTITELNTTSRTLKLTLEGTSADTATLSYTTPLVKIYGKSQTSITDVKAGDRVTVQLNTTQDQVSEIQVHKNVQFEVVSVSVNASSKILTVRLPNTTKNETYYLSDNVTITNEANADVNLASLTAGTLINVTMQGYLPSSVRTVQVYAGKVTSIDAAGNLTFQTASGENVTKSIGTNPIVRRDGTALTLSAVQVGDMIELSRDENDRVVLELATVISRTFWKIVNGTPQILYLKDVPSGNKTFYNLSPQIVVRQGSTQSTLSALKDGDKVTLYVFRGNVIEIVK